MACLRKSEDKLKYEPPPLMEMYLLVVIPCLRLRGPGAPRDSAVFYLAYNFCGYRHIYRVYLAFLSSGDLISGSQ